ncbi:hypothetical protein [Promicromonospora aerolata]|uniref:Uncharacterized protein n=1 Tax=Promicromonospora aerolata TaxID=195749 RepID=A0ABW4V2G8_9MICO
MTTFTALAPAPRWSRFAAHAVTFVVLPSSLWRIGVALGANLGYTDEGRAALVGDTVWGPAYMIALSVLAEVAALLTLALVRSRPVEVPRWSPVLRGRPLPRRFVLAVAWTGVALTAVIWTPFVVWWTLPHDDMTTTGALLVGFLYLPLVAWAPLLAAVTSSYQRRTARGTR